jgi:fatty-acyl-CoA synthase
MYPIDFLRRAAALHPGRIAIRHGDASLPYADLLRRVDALAAAFQHLAGKERLTVAVLAPNSLPLFAAILAVHAAGAILVPLNPRNASPELNAQRALAQPDLLVVDNELASRVEPGGAQTVLAGVASHTRWPTLDDLAAEFAGRAPCWPAVQAGDDYAYKFTGGSSGRPKAVRQSFRSHMTMVANVLDGLRLGDAEVFHAVTPMTHAAGSFMLPILGRGGTYVIGQSTKAGPMLDELALGCATMTWVTPTLLYSLVDEQERSPRALPHLRHLMFGGGPTAADVLARGVRAFGPVLETSFGQTEASTAVTILPADELVRPGLATSAGRACLLTSVAIIDADGRPLPPGEPGEIAVGGDLLMNGYLGMDDETRKVLRDGWLRTGDVGLLDANGYLYVRDRIRDVVISGGFNIYPSDVEAALLRHPAILEAVAFGLPDPHWGERLEAAVELRPGAQATDAEILSFAREQLGPVKTPKRLHVAAELPRSPVGKVLRREAKVRFGG